LPANSILEKFEGKYKQCFRKMGFNKDALNLETIELRNKYKAVILKKDYELL
jgi:hypothetical protein